MIVFQVSLCLILSFRLYYTVYIPGGFHAKIYNVDSNSISGADMQSPIGPV